MKKERITPEEFVNSKTCFLSNFPPKECGIATFTKDLSSAMDRRWNPKLKSRVIAITENTALYNYNKKVIMEISKEDIESYIQIAKKINENDNIKIVSIQHEFGIFGGEYGSYLIPFLEAIKKPAVLTFHSVLPNPDEMRKKIVNAICSRCEGVIVMANTAVDILEKDYGIEREKIHVVHHGIPNVSFQKNNSFKQKLNLNEKIILSTFGLLSRGKGIEYLIKSLPSLVKKYPNLLYLIIGETHPAVRKEEGEEYRNELIALVEKLGLKNNVKFYNKYLTLKEIVSYLLATDIYICTNLERNQITSGTLAYALGCGRAVVSTPSIYAEEMLSDNRGVLAKFKDPESYAKAIDSILSDKEFKEVLEKNAYTFSRTMIWSNVAYKYLKIFNQIIHLRKDTTEKFPKIKLDHLKRLTDDFGIVQFAIQSTPDKAFGYTLDDNARALIVAALHYKLFKSESSNQLAKTYLNFLEQAQDETGDFKNQHRNKEEISNPHSEDAFGRAVWSLGFVLNESQDPEIIEKAKKIFENSFQSTSKINSARAIAFAIMGLSYYYKTYPKEEILAKIKELAEKLKQLYEKESAENWNWFEPSLTYSNGKLPKAMFLAYESTKDKKYLEIAEKTLNFLSDLYIVDGKLSPIGQNGWYNRHDKRAFFDQQPSDASSLVQAFLTAYKVTKNPDYYEKAVLAFNWFLGKNHLDQMIYDEISGGCFDGLGKHSLNFNQGAESTISYLIARLMLEEQKKEIHSNENIH